MNKNYLSQLFQLQDKVAVLTGGGGVLCSTMSKALAKTGVKVVALDLIRESAQNVVDEIQSSGGEAFAVQCDVLDKASIEQAAETILDKFGRVDILINGAGGNKKEATTSPDLSFFDLPEAAVQWVFNLNVQGTLLPCQVFGQIMVEQGEGVILNISSMSAFQPLIRVNALAPGFFLTEQNRFLLTNAESGELTPRGKTIIDHTPQRHFGDPEDLLGAMFWLLSPASKFVTGIVVPVDGGFSAFSGV
jgi:NAD(P)-dependent dehydrogenase (short-subunit alcohol dehydrogenase family)